MVGAADSGKIRYGKLVERHPGSDGAVYRNCSAGWTAAAGMATVMLFAIIFHIMRVEFPVVVFNLILGGVAVFIVWGRFTKERLL